MIDSLKMRTLEQALVESQGKKHVPFSGRFRPHKRKSRRAVPGIKPGPALRLDDSIPVWSNDNHYYAYMRERGRRPLSVDEQVHNELNNNINSNEGENDNE